jgi:8-oxo-dGTP pyrophosphatase MutT (NUDIX family)
VRHTYTPGWHFTGGGIEVGQAAEEALADELAQETGLCVSGAAQPHGIFFNSCVSRSDHAVVHLCDAIGELPNKPPSLEISELRYFVLEYLPADVDPGTAQRF